MALEVFLRVFQTVVGVLGITGNSIVCIVIYKVQSMHTLTNAFIFNQAVVDLLGSAVLILSANIPLPVTYPPGPAGVLLCRIWTSGFVQFVFLYTSTFNLTAVTLERYFAIVFPFRYQAMFGRVQATITIACVWVCGIIVEIYGVFRVINQGDKCIDYAISGTRIFGVLFFILNFFLPLVTMLAAYAHIAVTLKRSARSVAPQPRPRAADDPDMPGQPVPESQDGSLMRARRNTLKALFFVFVAYVVCWSPGEILFFLSNLGLLQDLHGAIITTSVVFVVINSCINPFIYALKYRSFQDGLRKVFGRRQRQHGPGSHRASRIVDTTVG